jgi:hypothetical protein
VYNIGGEKINMDEVALAKPVVQWLLDQHWEVYQEVQYEYSGRVADIVAKRDNIIWVIETKTSYGFAVLEQATRWPVHYRSVAVPFARERDYRVAKDYYRVGVIEVSNKFETTVTEVIPAPLFSKNIKEIERFKNCLMELHKTYAEAGSQSGHHLTPYKYTMLEVRKAIESNPGCTIKFLYEQLGKMHYSNATSFKGNLVKALVDFEKDWCRVDFSIRPYKLYAKDKP